MTASPRGKELRANERVCIIITGRTELNLYNIITYKKVWFRLGYFLEKDDRENVGDVPQEKAVS